MRTLPIRILSLVVCMSLFAAPAAASAEWDEGPDEIVEPSLTFDEVEEGEASHGLLHTVLWYVPDRLLDVLDIFRLRVRLGPGVAAGVRATKVAQAYVGSYASLYAGLPGPRLRRIPKSPVGVESYNGIAISVVEAATGGGVAPDYSSTELGFDLQLGIIGLAFGVDPVEILDLGAGLLTFDPREDDI